MILYTIRICGSSVGCAHAASNWSFTATGYHTSDAIERPECTTHRPNTLCDLAAQGGQKDRDRLDTNRTRHTEESNLQCTGRRDSICILSEQA